MPKHPENVQSKILSTRFNLGAFVVYAYIGSENDLAGCKMQNKRFFFCLLASGPIGLYFATSKFIPNNFPYDCVGIENDIVG